MASPLSSQRQLNLQLGALNRTHQVVNPWFLDVIESTASSEPSMASSAISNLMSFVSSAATGATSTVLQALALVPFWLSLQL